MKETRSLLLVVLITLPGSAALSQSAEPRAQRVPGRIIGVFDNLSGQPVAGAIVEDLLTGWSALTSATGTVALFHVDTGGSIIRVRKLGHVAKVLPVKNSPSDTITLTLLLDPAPSMLGVVVTTARGLRGPADTVPKLESVGMELYDVADVPSRFNRTVAPGKIPCGATLIWTR